MIPDKNVDEARARAGALVGLIDLLGKDANADDIQRASMVPLSDEAFGNRLSQRHTVEEIRAGHHHDDP